MTASPPPVAVRPRETFAGTAVEVVRKGAGRPILLLHGLHDVRPDAPFVEALAAHGEVIAPTHPGFGSTPRPEGFSTVYDLVHHYRAVVETLAAPPVVVGLSFGGWIAAELAAAGVGMERLVLVDALGLRISRRDERDIAHLFNTAPEELLARGWSDPAARPAGTIGAGWQTMLDELADEELLRLNRSNEALCLYGWRPHMHNPQLARWLSRIAVPTLVVWGADDRIVTPAYGRHYAGLIPGSRFEIVPGAGHHPELERPDAFAGLVADFLTASRKRAA